MESLHAEIANLRSLVVSLDKETKAMIAAQNDTYIQRRITDDKRAEEWRCDLETLKERTDAHGKRTTKLEVFFEAFVGENGAFRMLMKNTSDNGLKLDEQSKKLDGFKDTMTGIFTKLLIAGGSGALAIVGAIILWLVQTHK